MQNQLTEINMYSSDEKIENMSIEQAIEIIQKHVDLGHKSGEFKPRKHMTKALEIALEALEDKRI